MFHYHELPSSKFVVVASIQDPAGLTMISYLRTAARFQDPEHDDGELSMLSSARYSNVLLCISSSDLLHLENLDSVCPHAAAFIFLSKHKSESEIPTLTCHCTGNFGGNPFGGNPGEIAVSYPSLQKSYLRALTMAGNKVPGYDIVIEATHHGPTSLRKPVLFVELGSSEKQWSDNKAGSVICDVVLDLLQSGFPRCTKVGIAFGGTHYPSKFNRLLLQTEYGLAAVASKHNLDAVDREMMNQMISKSIEKVTSIVLDEKGLGGHRDRILDLAEETDLEIVKL